MKRPASSSLTDLSAVKKQFNDQLQRAYSNVQATRDGNMSKLKNEIEQCNLHIQQSFEEKFRLSHRLGQDCLSKAETIGNLRRLLDGSEKKTQGFVAFDDLNKFVNLLENELLKEVNATILYIYIYIFKLHITFILVIKMS